MISDEFKAVCMLQDDLKAAKAQRDVLRDCLYWVLGRIDGDLHATARDINNGLGSGNDVYEDCERLEENIIGALRSIGEDI